VRSKLPVFISARVDRWSAAARLLIGAPASLPVSHLHVDAPSTRAAISCCISSSFGVVPLYISPCVPLARAPSPRPSFLSSPLASSSCLSPLSLSLSLSLSLACSLPSSLGSSLFSLSRRPPRSCLRLPPIIPPSPSRARPPRRARRSSFSPPCRPIIRSLFTLIFSFVSHPHTREPRNLHFFSLPIPPHVYTLLLLLPPRPPNPGVSFHPSPATPWSPSRSHVHSLFLPSRNSLAPSRPPVVDLPRCARLFLPRLLLSIERCVAMP